MLAGLAGVWLVSGFRLAGVWLVSGFRLGGLRVGFWPWRRGHRNCSLGA